MKLKQEMSEVCNETKERGQCAGATGIAAFLRGRSTKNREGRHARCQHAMQTDQQTAFITSVGWCVIVGKEGCELGCGQDVSNGKMPCWAAGCWLLAVGCWSLAVGGGRDRGRSARTASESIDQSIS